MDHEEVAVVASVVNPCEPYAASLVSEDSLDKSLPKFLQRKDTLSPSSFKKQRQQQQQQLHHANEPEPEDDATEESAKSASLSPLVVVEYAIPDTTPDTDEETARLEGETLKDEDETDSGARDSPEPATTFLPRAHSAVVVNTALSEAGNGSRSPGASIYYCNSSFPGRQLPHALCHSFSGGGNPGSNPGSNACSSIVLVSSGLPHRAAASQERRGSMSSSSVVAPLDPQLLSSGGDASAAPLRAARSTSLSSLPPSADTPPRPSPHLRPPAPRGFADSGFSHFSVNGKRVQHLPRSVNGPYVLQNSRGLGGDGAVFAGAKPRRTVVVPAEAAAATAELCSAFSDSTENPSVSLQEQDLAVDDLFTSREFLAFMSGNCGDVPFGLCNASSPTASHSCRRASQHKAVHQGTMGGVHGAPSAAEFSVPGCSSCDLSFSGSAGSIFNQEAARTLSRNGAKRSTNFLVPS